MEILMKNFRGIWVMKKRWICCWESCEISKKNSVGGYGCACCVLVGELVSEKEGVIWYRWSSGSLPCLLSSLTTGHMIYTFLLEVYNPFDPHQCLVVHVKMYCLCGGRNNLNIINIKPFYSLQRFL